MRRASIPVRPAPTRTSTDRKSTRLNSSHTVISYAVFCLKKKKKSVIIGRAMAYIDNVKIEDQPLALGSHRQNRAHYHHYATCHREHYIVQTAYRPFRCVQ